MIGPAVQLFEAIVEANRRRVAGDKGATVPVAEFRSALPVAALTCIDARLNHLLPDLLGLPEEHFIWLRNAGNIITGPLSSTMRSLALSCAIKGAREIAVIGHSDCLVGKTTTLNLLDRLAALGIERSRLPDNLVEYFGLFGTERQNVIRSVDFIRISPLIGARVPVHGLLLDVKSGQLEWLVNGYQGFQTLAVQAGQALQAVDRTLESLGKIGDLSIGGLRLPEEKIGEMVKTAHNWVHQAEAAVARVAPKPTGNPEVAAPSTLPQPLSLAAKLKAAATSRRP